MVSSTRQNNGEMFRKERAIQVRAAGDPAARVESTQPPRLTTTGDGPKRAGDRGGTREFQQFRFDPQHPADQNGRRPQGVADVPLTQREPPPATWAKRVNSAGVVRKDGTGANRMTGVVTRDSAQRQPIASIGRTRGLTYSTTRPLAPANLAEARRLQRCLVGDQDSRACSWRRRMPTQAPGYANAVPRN